MVHQSRFGLQNLNFRFETGKIDKTLKTEHNTETEIL